MCRLWLKRTIACATLILFVVMIETQVWRIVSSSLLLEDCTIGCMSENVYAPLYSGHQLFDLLMITSCLLDSLKQKHVTGDNSTFYYLFLLF